jgi:hypothetical protein
MCSIFTLWTPLTGPKVDTFPKLGIIDYPSWGRDWLFNYGQGAWRAVSMSLTESHSSLCIWKTIYRGRLKAEREQKEWACTLEAQNPESKSRIDFLQTFQSLGFMDIFTTNFVRYSLVIIYMPFHKHELVYVCYNKTLMGDPSFAHSTEAWQGFLHQISFKVFYGVP